MYYVIYWNDGKWQVLQNAPLFKSLTEAYYVCASLNTHAQPLHESFISCLSDLESPETGNSFDSQRGA